MHDTNRPDLERAVRREVRAELARREDLTRPVVAARLGWHRSALHARLAGETAIKINDLDAIASALDTTASALVAKAEQSLAASEAVAS